MKLKTTPKFNHCRDDIVFPEAALRRAECRCPRYYWIEVRRGRVAITFDGFWLPRPMPENLAAIYGNYVHAWANSRKKFPKHGLGWPGEFRDYVSVLVKEEHAPSWIALFNRLSRYAYNVWEEDLRQRRPAGERGMTLQ